MNNERPREEDLKLNNKLNNKDRKPLNPSDEEVIRKTLEEKGPLGEKVHEELEPTGLSSDGRM